ncbi:MAG: UDP-N-acetylmuramoyl-tripeptide--D-alanyl-D-alanine ligase [Magnetococcales bacterium]|nr:UDP-N-acetylmuramoyl-tripeptide--D-alanyl-D-alanine ligase [Magnetococcales bacterium]
MDRNTIFIDFAFLLEATNGQPVTGAVLPPPVLSGVSIDSRTLQPGSLFVALVGPRFDGHDFIEAAVAKGAAALLLQRPPDQPLPVPAVVVADTQAALTRLAAAWRARVNPQVIGITGSVGKTTVKEMTAAALAGSFRVHATRGNLNNHIGLPLTLLSMPADCEVLVVELGMSAAGEIRALASLARPRVGVVTNIGVAHLAAFADGVAGIARAKGELLESLPAAGLALLPADDPFIPLLATLTTAPVRTFGSGVAAPVRAEDLTFVEGRARFRLVIEGAGAVEVTLNHAGDHMIQNALAAAGTAAALGVPMAAIGAALGAFQTPPGRGGTREAPGGWRVVDDTYNANPASVAAALRTLARSAPPGHRVAVLGDMLELGVRAEELHAGLAETVLAVGVDRLFVAGDTMAALDRALKDRLVCRHRNDPTAWLGQIAPDLRPGDVVLVKGSRGMRMERIVKDLMAE